jgi:excisionase family DNA binding protein
MRNATQANVPKRIPRRQPPKRIATTVNDTCRITGLGRTKIYELIAEQKLETVAVGRRRLVNIRVNRGAVTAVH